MVAVRAQARAPATALNRISPRTGSRESARTGSHESARTSSRGASRRHRSAPAVRDQKSLLAGHLGRVLGRPPADLGAQPDQWVVLAPGHPLLHRNERVVGDLDVLWAY